MSPRQGPGGVSWTEQIYRNALPRAGLTCMQPMLIVGVFVSPDHNPNWSTVFTHIYASATVFTQIYGYKRSVSFMKPTPFAIYQHWRRDTPAKHNKILVRTAQMVIF